MPSSMLITIVHSWAFLQLDCKPFTAQPYQKKLGTHREYCSCTQARQVVVLQTYLLPKHSEEEVHEDGVFARVLLTQSIDGLHHHHLQEKDTNKKIVLFHHAGKNN